MSIHLNGNHSDLSQEHIDLLHSSAIADAVILARGYRTITTVPALQIHGFRNNQLLMPSLLIPLYGIDGKVVGHQLRPDKPRSINGKVVKYEVPKGSKLVIDVPPTVQAAVLNGTVPLYITEGTRKADAAATKGLACVSISGVWGWKKQEAFWKALPLAGRRVIIAFDSDIRTNAGVQRAAEQLSDLLRQLGAQPHFVLLAPGPKDEKVGLDDYFASGKTVADLEALEKAEVPSAVKPRTPRYTIINGGIALAKVEKRGVTYEQLTNFNAIIRGDLLYDDGQERQRHYDIQATLHGRTVNGTVTADEFDRMTWVPRLLGASAIVYPVWQVQQHVRTAIQLNSGSVPTTTVYTHTGWVNIDGGWGYLHAGGIIRADNSAGGPDDAEDRPGANSPTSNRLQQHGPIGPMPEQKAPVSVRVELPEAMSRYCLPEPPTGPDRVTAIRSSLQFLDVAPDRVTLSMYAALGRSVLGNTNFGVGLIGQTGNKKTTLTALLQQHMGPELDYDHIPASWTWTVNSLEALAFQVKDGMLFIDDFVPKGSRSDMDRLHRDSDRLLRNQGNRTGRGRCGRDGSLKEGKPPRGMIFITGEDRLQGQSLNARMLTLELAADAIRLPALNVCQREARDGLFAQAMAGYLKDVAGRYENAMQEVAVRFRYWREIFQGRCRHPRVVSIFADLAVGFEDFLGFALRAGAIDETEYDKLWDRFEKALSETAKEQDQEQEANDPLEQFLMAFQTALTTGEAHLELDDGRPPEEDPELLGWKQITVKEVKKDENGKEETETKDVWVRRNPNSQLIGWIRGHDVLLNPAATVEVVNRYSKESGERLLLTQRSIGKFLDEKGVLISKDKGRYTKKTMINGAQLRVLHISLGNLFDLWNPRQQADMDTLMEFKDELLGKPPEGQEDDCEPE